ncbi:molecular chaperone DnaK, partial [Streptomyces sp. NPDC022067]
MLVNDAREAVRNEAGVERTRPLISELQQVHAGLVAHEPAGAGAGAAGGEAGPGEGGAQGTGAGGGEGVDEDVIDAEFDKG